MDDIRAGSGRCQVAMKLMGKELSRMNVMAGLWLAVMLAGCTSTTGAADAEAFREISYAEALTAAKAEGKPVLIDFYTTWCGPCKMLDRSTWPDAEVQQWLMQKTVALKIDAEREEALAEKHRINSYPTIILLRPDGSEIDRLVGFRNAGDFLNDAKAALAGKDSVMRPEASLRENPEQRMCRGESLVNTGKHAEALQEYLWCFDHGLEHDATFDAVRSFTLLERITELGRDYPAAIIALKDRRELLETKLLTKRSDWDVVKDIENLDGPHGLFRVAQDLTAINRVLNEPERTLSVYDRVSNAGPLGEVIHGMMTLLIEDELIAARRYKDVVANAPDAKARLKSMMKNIDEEKEKHGGGVIGGMVEETLGEMILQQGSKSFEALLGVGQDKDAKQIAGVLMKFKPTGETYAKLIEHALRCERPDVARQIAERAKKKLPEDEHDKVNAAAAKIAGER